MLEVIVLGMAVTTEDKRRKSGAMLGKRVSIIGLYITLVYHSKDQGKAMALGSSQNLNRLY